jgi:hypothetical protein
MLERVTMGGMALAVALGVAAPASADGTTKPACEAQDGNKGAGFHHRPVWARPRTERVSVGTGGVQSNGYSSGWALSADGRFMAFSSAATNPVPGGGRNISSRPLAQPRLRRLLPSAGLLRHTWIGWGKRPASDAP